MFADAANQKVATELSVDLLQTFAVTLERLALIDDKPRSASLSQHPSLSPLHKVQ